MSNAFAEVVTSLGSGLRSLIIGLVVLVMILAAALIFTLYLYFSTGKKVTPPTEPKNPSALKAGPDEF